MKQILTPRNEIAVFHSFLVRLELWFFGLFNHIFDLNTDSCAHAITDINAQHLFLPSKIYFPVKYFDILYKSQFFNMINRSSLFLIFIFKKFCFSYWYVRIQERTKTRKSATRLNILHLTVRPWYAPNAYADTGYWNVATNLERPSKTTQNHGFITK